MSSVIEASLSRRRTLILGSSLAAGLVANEVFAAGDSRMAPVSAGGKLPVKQMEEILQTDGELTDGVLSISQDRKDLHVTGPADIPFKAAWQVNNEFAFQSIGFDKAIISAELSLLSKEANPVIDQLTKQGLTFQAFHQHFFDLSPQLFHIHFRGVGKPLDLARAVAAVVGATGTPLPQKAQADRKTPLDKNMLEKILGGTAEVGDDGVVIVSIPRKETIVVGGVAWRSNMGVSHTMAFEPLDGGKRTAVAPDFALIASEINSLVQFMRVAGFTIHCLYNQETAESPQLYFSHQLAVGDAYELARKIRKALERTNTKFKS